MPYVTSEATAIEIATYDQKNRVPQSPLTDHGAALPLHGNPVVAHWTTIVQFQR